MKRGVYFRFVFLLIFIIAFSSLTSAATRNCWSCENCTAELGASVAGDIVLIIAPGL